MLVLPVNTDTQRSKHPVPSPELLSEPQVGAWVCVWGRGGHVFVTDLKHASGGSER